MVCSAGEHGPLSLPAALSHIISSLAFPSVFSSLYCSPVGAHRTHVNMMADVSSPGMTSYVVVRTLVTRERCATCVSLSYCCSDPHFNMLHLSSVLKSLSLSII